ncbi:MAG TPA: hypothetical protein VHG72_07125 [Polyangia bacterium]|nr:hypothetical protein [Polyangia bacterium]
MDLRIIHLPSGGVAETNGDKVRITTPSAGALAAHPVTRSQIQATTVAEAEAAIGRRLVTGLWWLTTGGAKTTAVPADV